MIYKGEWQVFAERHQPEAEAGQVHRKWVLVHPVEAALRHQSTGVDQGLLAISAAAGQQVLRQLFAPGPEQQLRQEAAQLYQKRPRPHGRIADPQRQDLLRRWPVAMAFQPGPQGIGHGELGELGWCVVTAAAPPFLRRLKHQAAGGLHALEQAPINSWGQRRHQLLLAARLLQGCGRLGGQIGVRLFFQPGLALGPGQREQFGQIDGGGERLLAALGLAAEAEAGAGYAGHREIHDPLVHRTDLAHVEGAVVDPLPLDDQQVAEHCQHHRVADPRRFQPAIGRWIKQLALAGRQVVGAGTAAYIYEPEQAAYAAPGPIALLHRVGVAGGVTLQLGQQGGELVVLLKHRLIRHQVDVLRVEQEHQPQHHGDQAAVEPLRIFLGQIAQADVAWQPCSLG